MYFIASPSFPGSSVGKESPWSARDAGSTPRSGRSPGGGHGNPLQDSSLENPMDRGAWRVHNVAKSCTWLKWLSTQAGHSEVWSAPTASRELLLCTESQLNLPAVNIFLTSVPWMSYGHADLFILSVFKGTGGTQQRWGYQQPNERDSLWGGPRAELPGQPGRLSDKPREAGSRGD